MVGGVLCTAVATRKTRFPSIKFPSTVIQDRKPCKGDENGFHS